MSRTPVTREEALADLQKQLGFVPNLLAELAKSPAVLELYLKGGEILDRGMLTRKEQQAVYLATSQFNGCDYCLAVHARQGLAAGLSLEDVRALGEGTPPADERIGRLAAATRSLLASQGKLEESQISELEAQGIDRGQLYEVFALAQLKSITNFAHRVSKVPIDAIFLG